MAFFQFLNDFFRFCVAVRRGRFTFLFPRCNEGLTFYSSRSFSFDCKFLVNFHVFHLWHCYHVPGTQNSLKKCQSTETYTAWKVSVFGVILMRILAHSYSVRMRENADQYNSEYGHFLCSVTQRFYKFFSSVFCFYIQIFQISNFNLLMI